MHEDNLSHVAKTKGDIVNKMRNSVGLLCVGLFTLVAIFAHAQTPNEDLTAGNSGGLSATHGITNWQNIPNRKSAVIRFYGTWYIYGWNDNRAASAAGYPVRAGGNFPSPDGNQGCVIVRVNDHSYGCPTEKNRIPDSFAQKLGEPTPAYEITVPGPGMLSFQVNDDNLDDNRGGINVQVFFADCATCKPPVRSPSKPTNSQPPQRVTNNNCSVGTPGQTGACNFGGAGVSNVKAYCSTNCPANMHGFCAPFTCAGGIAREATCGCYPPAGPGIITSIP